MTDDPGLIWRRQPKENPDMDFQQVRALARGYEARMRRSKVALSLGMLAGVGLAAYLAFTTPLPLARFGEALLAIGFLVLLARGWREASATPPDDAAECVAFLRARLVERRDAARAGWIWRMAPLGPGIVTVLVALALAAGSAWLQLVPIFALLAVWFGAMLLIQRREAARVEAEIAQLDRLRAI